MIKRPDYQRWLQKPWWRMDDAVLLVLGIDPESQHHPRRRPKEGGLRMKVSTLPNVFWGFLDTAMKSEGRDLDVVEYSSEGTLTIAYAKVEPLVFVKWAQKLGFTIPPELLEYLQDTKQGASSEQDDIQQENSAWIVEGDYAPEPGKREKQLKYIAEVISALDYEPLAIPYGGKGEIKNRCEKELSLFEGAYSFDHAWKEARKQALVKMEDHDEFCK